MLAITGVMLNHIDWFVERNTHIQSNWILDWYGVHASRNVVGQSISGVEVISGDGTIFINFRAVLFDQAPLLAIVVHGGLLNIITREHLHVFTLDAEKVESVAMLGISGDAYLTERAGLIKVGASALDLNFMTLADWSGEIAITKNITAQLMPMPQAVSLVRRSMLRKSQVLLDVHSGRFFGSTGRWIIDISAALFGFLATSGIILWTRRSRRRT